MSDRAEVKLTILEAVVNENEILLDNIDSTDVAEIDGLTGITADEIEVNSRKLFLTKETRETASSTKRVDYE